VVSFEVIALVEKSLTIPVALTGMNDSAYSITPNELIIYYLLPDGTEGYTVDDFVVEADIATIDEDSTLIPLIVSQPSRISGLRTDTIRVQLQKN
jgi:hypothetical protein